LISLIQIVTICTIILVARPNFLTHTFRTRLSYFSHAIFMLSIASKMLYSIPYSFRETPEVSICRIISGRERRSYWALKAAITPWSISWSRQVVLGGGGTVLTLSTDLTSSKFGGCPGALSSNRRAFRGTLFDCKSLTHYGESV
jgi:hypothetical protein